MQKRIFHRILLGVLLPTLVFGGCAYRRMIFNKLDWLIVYQMDSYLDLTDTQEKTVRIPVVETVNWLKAERLPAITDLLRDVQTAVEARRIDARAYEKWLAQVNVWRMEVTERMTPPLAFLLMQLNPDQIEHLQNKLVKSDRKLARLLEYSEADFPEELADYVDDNAAKYKFWVGRLRKDQKTLMVDKLGWTRASLGNQLKQRQRSREFWIGLLRKHERGQLVTALHASAEPEGAFRDPEYLRMRKESQQRMQDFLLALFASLDQEQWRHLEKVIKELVVDMDSMSVNNQRSQH